MPRNPWALGRNPVGIPGWRGRKRSYRTLSFQSSLQTNCVMIFRIKAQGFVDILKRLRELTELCTGLGAMEKNPRIVRVVTERGSEVRDCTSIILEIHLGKTSQVVDSIQMSVMSRETDSLRQRYDCLFELTDTI